MVNHRPRPSVQFIAPDTARGQALALLRLLRAQQEGATRNEIARMSGLPIQSVCARVGELLETGDALRAGRRVCRVTGHANEIIIAPQPRGQTLIDGWRQPA